MSYFINPDGTVEFVADRYDSAGNILPAKGYTTADRDEESQKRLVKQRKRNASNCVRTNGKTTLGEHIVFQNGLFYPEKVVLRSKHDVKALQKLLENNMYKMTNDEANIIRKKIKEQSVLSSFNSRFGSHNHLL